MILDELIPLACKEFPLALDAMKEAIKNYMYVDTCFDHYVYIRNSSAWLSHPVCRGIEHPDSFSKTTGKLDTSTRLKLTRLPSKPCSESWAWLPEDPDDLAIVMERKRQIEKTELKQNKLNYLNNL